jgi:hypothetical protein
MKGQKKPFFFFKFGVVVALPLFLAVTPVAFAHSTGHESRTVADCEKLPGTAKSGERGACLKCVSLPKPHHFHPDYPQGNRCRPDNGKP